MLDLQLDTGYCWVRIDRVWPKHYNILVAGHRSCCHIPSPHVIIWHYSHLGSTLHHVHHYLQAFSTATQCPALSSPTGTRIGHYFISIQPRSYEMLDAKLEWEILSWQCVGMRDGFLNFGLIKHIHPSLAASERRTATAPHTPTNFPRARTAARCQQHFGEHNIIYNHLCHRFHLY